MLLGSLVSLVPLLAGGTGACTPEPPPAILPPPPPGPLVTIEDPDGDGFLDIIVNGVAARDSGLAGGVIRDDFVGVEILRLECDTGFGPQDAWVDVDEFQAEGNKYSIRARATSLGLSWYEEASGTNCQRAYEPTASFDSSRVPTELLALNTGKLTADGESLDCEKMRFQVRTWIVP